MLFQDLINKTGQYDKQDKIYERHNNGQAVFQADCSGPETHVFHVDHHEYMSAEQQHRYEITVFPAKLRYRIAGPHKRDHYKQEHRKSKPEDEPWNALQPVDLLKRCHSPAEILIRHAAIPVGNTKTSPVQQKSLQRRKRIE